MHAGTQLDNKEKEINVRSPLLAYFLVLAATLLVTTELIFDHKLFANYHMICEFILQFLFGMFVFEFVTQYFWNPIEYFTYHTLPKIVEKLARGEECLFYTICSDDCKPFTLFLYAVSWFLFYCGLKRSKLTCKPQDSSPENNNNYWTSDRTNNSYCTTGNNNYSLDNVDVAPPLPSIYDQQKGTRMCDISRQERQHNKTLTSHHNKSTDQKLKKKNDTKKNTTNAHRSRRKSPRKNTAGLNRCMDCRYSK